MMLRTALAGLFLVAAAGSAAAHPHVFVDARAEVVFDANGEISAVRNIWQFDQAFTSYAVQGLDLDADGKLTDAELVPLAKVNVESLQEFGFFTWIRAGTEAGTFVPPTEYWLEFHDSRLTLFFTLPLKTPVAVRPAATIEVFDPDYFVAFTFSGGDAITLDNAPSTCTAAFKPPGELDNRTMAMLNQIPRDQPDLPADLQAAASVLANLILVRCR